MNVAKLEISVEAQGKEVEVALEPVAEDDEGFARSVLISPRTEWPASEGTLHIESALDLAGNTREPYAHEIRLPSSVLNRSEPLGRGTGAARRARFVGGLLHRQRLE